ncbi:hypothetical protein MNBD_ALPHA05-2353, partial [hydrothermal vent metagenome]
AASIRYRADVGLGQQLKFDNDNFEVVSIESEDEQGRRITLICEEVGG